MMLEQRSVVCSANDLKGKVHSGSEVSSPAFAWTVARHYAPQERDACKSSWDGIHSEEFSKRHSTVLYIHWNFVECPNHVPALQLGHQSASDHAIINEDSRKLHRVVKLEFLSMEPPRAKPYPYTLQDMPWSLDAMMIISSSS